MAKHARRQILEKVAQVLGAAFPDVRVANLYNVERQPIAAAVLVDWSGEVITEKTVMGQPPLQDRALQVEVKLLRQAADDVDLNTDADAEFLERTLAADTDLGGVVMHWRLLQVTKDLNQEGERPVMRLSYVYQADYRTRADAPATIIN